MAKIYKKKIKQYEDLFRDSFRELSMLMQSKLEFEKNSKLFKSRLRDSIGRLL